ncbi:MAG: small subunit ribosomal protein S16 [Candidatus Paceibacteria bacterium]|jgi:small subunit ribosomal protein S16
MTLYLSLTQFETHAIISHMLKIRLQRTGRKHEPTFRVVLTDSKNGPKSGKFIEILGNYDARDRNETRLKSDRITYWISQGAKLSDTLHNLFVDKKIIEGKKINVLPKKSPIVKEGEEVKEAPKEESPAPEEVKEEVEEVKEAPKEEVEVKESPAPEEVKEEVKEAPKEESPAPEEVKEETKEEVKEEVEVKVAE